MTRLFGARIIINDTITDDVFRKSFLLKLYNLGATITVVIDGKTLYLERKEDYLFFKKCSAKISKINV